MPTIFIVFGFIFKFFSDDHEPIHVHIIKGGCAAKYNVEPDVKMVYNHGFKKHELSVIEGIIEENVQVIINRWHECFNNNEQGR
jgi:hypothetical protein